MSQKNNIDFSVFFSSNPEEWKLAIVKELKIANEDLLIKSSEGLDIKGFYTHHDLNELTYLSQFHDQWKLKSPRQWQTLEYLPMASTEVSENLIFHAQKGGADGYYFDLKKHVKSTKEITRLLRNVDKSKHWILARTESSFYELNDCLQNVDKFDLKGLILLKSNFTKVQNLMDNLRDYQNTFESQKNHPQLRRMGIDCSEIEASAPSQIAISLAFAIELLDKLSENGHLIYDLLPHIGFSISIKDHYFIEIAKLRAFRLLWSMIVKAYQTNFDSFSTPIHCITLGGINIDSNTNLLHHTTQAMAAIIGGCDALTILPSDIHIKEHNDFSSRMARNISILLKEEAHLDYTTDPAGGSYMIESLTHQIAQAALNQLKTIEENGGLINYLKGGFQL